MSLAERGVGARGPGWPMGRGRGTFLGDRDDFSPIRECRGGTSAPKSEVTSRVLTPQGQRARVRKRSEPAVVLSLAIPSRADVVGLAVVEIGSRDVLCD